jgi:hypothetical protein
LHHDAATLRQLEHHQLADWTSRDVKSAIEFDTARYVLNTPGMRSAQVAKAHSFVVYFWIMERTRPSH